MRVLVFLSAGLQVKNKEWTDVFGNISSLKKWLSDAAGILYIVSGVKWYSGKKTIADGIHKNKAG